MRWLLPYGIGALVWLVLMLFAAQVSDGDDASRRRIAMTALRDAAIWPLALLRLAACVIDAIPEALSEHEQEKK